MFGIKDILTGLGGAVVAALLILPYNYLVENPAIKKETRAIVEAESVIQTQEAINEVSDLAERARAMRRYCADRGLHYNSAEVECRDK